MSKTLTGTTKEEILGQLVDSVVEKCDLKHPKKLLKAILDREASSSTFLPTGIAIPHARIADVDEIKLVMGVMPEGFKEADDSNPVRLFFLFFSPIKDVEFGRHLKLLSKIASVFRDPEFIDKVAAAKTPEAIFSLIQHKERETLEEPTLTS